MAKAIEYNDRTLYLTGAGIPEGPLAPPEPFLGFEVININVTLHYQVLLLTLVDL